MPSPQSEQERLLHEKIVVKAPDPGAANSSNSPRVYAYSVLILFLAGFLRFIDLNWDSTELISQSQTGFHRPYVGHVDERGLLNVAMQLDLHHWNPKWFAHGSLPIYFMKLGSAVMQLIAGPQWGDYGHMALVGRFIVALFGTATVWVVFVFGSRAFSPTVGFLGAFFLSISVLHIQMSHFATVDVPLVFFVTCALLFAHLYFVDGKIHSSLLLGFFSGLAMACKFSASTLAGLIIAIHSLRAIELRKMQPVTFCFYSLLFCIVGFFVGEPYAFLDAKNAWPAIFVQRDMVLGRNIPRFTQQYFHTSLFYPVVQLVRWGLGPALGLLVLASFVIGAILATKDLFFAFKGKKVSSGGLLVLSFWLVPNFLWNEMLPVKFPRYMLSLYPGWCLLAGFVCVHVWQRFERKQIFLTIFGGVLIVSMSLWTFAFMRIYRDPHPMMEATAWSIQNIPENSKILVEHLNEEVPLYQGLGKFQMGVRLPILDLPDSLQKLDTISKMMASADYLTLPNFNLLTTVVRLDRPDPNWPENVYPYCASFYELLMEERLGFHAEKIFTKYPRILGWEINDDPVHLSDPHRAYRCDLSFTFYDHPKVVIFRNINFLSADEIQRRVIERTNRIHHQDTKTQR